MTYIPFKVRVKLLLKKVFPTFLFSLIVTLWRNTFSKISSGEDMDIVAKYTKEFLDTHGYNVIGGPFKGLTYVEQAAGSSYLIKLVGSYEAILHEEIEGVKKRDYSTIIDIGCAEGYYLIGLGSYIKNAHLIGYDIDEQALTLTKKLYDINHLTNKITLLPLCTKEDLEQRIDSNTFLMCDAEGFEEEILNPENTPALRNVQTMIIELHDFAVPGIKKILTDRFKNTHTIKTIVFQNANPAPYPFLMNIHNKKHLYTILRERGEQEQEWLILEKK